MDLNKINDLLNELKMVMEKNKAIYIPNKGEQRQIQLKSNKHVFIVDLNRKGHKKARVTYQLRESSRKDFALLRLDLIGRDHPNPEGDFPYAGEIIPCPHLHVADPNYGSSIAYPLNTKYAKMFLNDDIIKDLAAVLESFLERCNVGNLDDYEIIYQPEII
ncbi:DUF6978 family protein [Piscibacillus halophilus]|uniref:DUF6978 family protein n=1 Tax=Piscibacillus halophilus TaxID=571933 RepID=UPI001588883C|nr:hypothetical protein [Piscibacillus halophilus]